MRISDWSSDVCSSDLAGERELQTAIEIAETRHAGTRGIDVAMRPFDAQRSTEQQQPVVLNERFRTSLVVRSVRLRLARHESLTMLLAGHRLRPALRGRFVLREVEWRASGKAGTDSEPALVS